MEPTTSNNESTPPAEAPVSDETLRALRAALARLQARVDALEAAAAARGAASARAPASAPAPAPTPPLAVPAQAANEQLPEEVLLVISAAAAAFLGKRPHIRQIRILSSASWSHQGRVSIQASHALRTLPGGRS